MLNYVRSFAVFPSKELNPCRYLRHSSQLSHREAAQQAKVLWTTQGSTVTVLIRIDDRIILR
jgi:hypothetical protein